MLFKVWQRTGSFCWCYIVFHCCLRFDRSGRCCGCNIFYHYCLMFDRGVVHVFYHYFFRFDRGVIHVVFVILSTITVLGLTEEWFILLLYCLPLLFKDWQMSDSCYCWLYCLLFLLKVWQRSGSCCWCYIVYHCWLRFVRWVVHVVVFILSTIAV